MRIVNMLQASLLSTLLSEYVLHNINSILEEAKNKNELYLQLPHKDRLYTLNTHTPQTSEAPHIELGTPYLHCNILLKLVQSA